MIDIEKREAAWDAYSQQPIEFTISSAFNAGYDAALSESAWVAVKNRVPKSGQMVLCQTREGRMVVNSWEAGCDQDERWFKKQFVAWKKSEPYTPQEKKNEQ